MLVKICKKNGHGSMNSESTVNVIDQEDNFIGANIAQQCGEAIVLFTMNADDTINVLYSSDQCEQNEKVVAENNGVITETGLENWTFFRDDEGCLHVDDLSFEMPDYERISRAIVSHDFYASNECYALRVIAVDIVNESKRDKLYMANTNSWYTHNFYVDGIQVPE
ncbi:hypothetical protein [Vibrio phage vB_pir03]|nr:hypothetical protein [Vibrio phage vB_pir03]